MNLATNFYLIAVPSHFKDTWGNEYAVYQLTANFENDFKAPQRILNFDYELSPITVQFYQQRENIFDFFIHICAIVGGIFTVAGIIDAVIHRSMGILFKKRIGKLS